MTGGIPLKRMIQELRRQVGEAIVEGGEAALKFRVEGIDLELQVSAKQSEEQRGGIEFWVHAGASTKDEHQTTQTVRLKLVPYDARAPEREVAVGDRRRIPEPGAGEGV